MESVEAQGFRRLLNLFLQCWSVELLQLFLRMALDVFSAGISACAVLPEDGII